MHCVVLQSAVLDFGEKNGKYSRYLTEKKRVVEENQRSAVPVRSADNAQQLEVLAPKVFIEPAVEVKYRELNAALSINDPYEPLFVNDFQPDNAYMASQHPKKSATPMCTVHTLHWQQQR